MKRIRGEATGISEERKEVVVGGGGGGGGGGVGEACWRVEGGPKGLGTTVVDGEWGRSEVGDGMM